MNFFGGLKVEIFFSGTKKKLTYL